MLSAHLNSIDVYLMTVFYRLLLSAVLTAAVPATLSLSGLGGSEISPNAALVAILFIAITIGVFISPAITAGGRNSKPKPKKAAAGREQGIVKWFNVSKGYGFVTRASGEEIFVHFRSIRGKGRKVLREGQKIEFTVTQGEKGPQAEDIEPLLK